MRLLLSSALCVSVATGFVARPSPADATTYTEGRFYVAPFVTDNGHPDRTQDGAYYWEGSRGFNGYLGPSLPRNSLAGYACDSPASGEIRVCEVSNDTVQAYAYHWGGIRTGDASKFVWKNMNYSSYPRRINSAFILIADNLSPENRQTAYRSAFGTALGLRPNTDGNADCITKVTTQATQAWNTAAGYPYMNQTTATVGFGPNTGSCSEDINAMSQLYPGSGWPIP